MIAEEYTASASLSTGETLTLKWPKPASAVDLKMIEAIFIRWIDSHQILKRIEELEAELKTRIELTDVVRQDASKPADEPDSAVAYLVYGQSDWSDRLFHEFRDAESFASQQLAKNGDLKSYSVYPLYATEPIEVSEKTATK